MHRPGSARGISSLASDVPGVNERKVVQFEYWPMKPIGASETYANRFKGHTSCAQIATPEHQLANAYNPVIVQGFECSEQNLRAYIKRTSSRQVLYRLQCSFPW